jgi:large subunit ribosomal protein L9
MLRQAGDRGQLYGSVSPRDIADVVTAGGFSVSRGQVPIDKAIKTIGLHEVSVVLHPEVRVKITINVARTEDEADRQARGEDVLAEAVDEEDAETAPAAEAMFEEGAGPKPAEESQES